MGNDTGVSPSNGCQFNKITLIKTAFLKATINFNRLKLSSYHLLKHIFCFQTRLTCTIARLYYMSHEISIICFGIFYGT